MQESRTVDHHWNLLRLLHGSATCDSVNART